MKKKGFFLIPESCKCLCSRTFLFFNSKSIRKLRLSAKTIINRKTTKKELWNEVAAINLCRRRRTKLPSTDPLRQHNPCLCSHYDRRNFSVRFSLFRDQFSLNGSLFLFFSRFPLFRVAQTTTKSESERGKRKMKSGRRRSDDRLKASTRKQRCIVSERKQENVAECKWM